MSDVTRPATVASGHLVLTEELREQIRERLLSILDGTTHRLEHPDLDQEEGADRGQLIDACDAIRAALVKLDAGYYGVCEMCEGPIPLERLEALPSVRNCVTCQARPQPLVR